MSSTGTAERNILLAVCLLFSLSAFGIATVEPLFWGGLVGWALAAALTLRLHTLRCDPERRPRGQVVDIILTGLITLLLSSAVYSVIVYYRTVDVPWERVEMNFETLQMIVFAVIVQVGGWTTSWVQGLRRIRLNIAYTDGR